MSEETQVNKNRNRKRKKSFLQNAKKYGKKGCFGRGSHLNEDTYQYFVNVLDLMKKGFDNDEEKEMFVNNVLEQTVNEEVNYSRNQVGCRVVEMLLPYANDEAFQRYLDAFQNEDLRPILSDRFASHVIETLVKQGSKRVIKQSNDNSKHFVLKISKFLLNNLEDFVWDTYANHIIRSALLSMAGIFENDDIIKSEIPDEFKEIVQEYAERLMQWPQFSDLSYEDITSGLLQSLITALRKVDLKLMSRLIKKLIDDSFINEENPLPPVFESPAAVRLLEVAIEKAKPKLYTQIYAKLFVNRLVELAKLKSTNFSVQKLLNCCVEKTEFEAIYQEISPELENIYLSGHSGVLLSLGQACKRLGAFQGAFIQQLMNILHCNEPPENQNHFVPALLRLIPFERLEKLPDNFPVNLHGSILIQTLLEFNKPIKIINSLLSMELSELKKMFCDSKGCHIMDAYMRSTFVGEKSREKLIRKLHGAYQELVANRYGSRSFDALWLVTSPKQKQQIMDELSHKEGSWSHTEYGKIIAGKLNLPLYKRSKDNWLQSLNKIDKTKQIFSDLIGE